MTGWIELGVVVFVGLVIVGLPLLTLAAVWHFVRWTCDERTEMRAERHTSREVPPCSR